MIYFDTSVLVAYYTPEERTDDASAIMAKATVPVLSDLGVAEFNVVIGRKQRSGFLSIKAAQVLFDLFDEHLRKIYLRVAIGPGSVNATRRLALQSKIALRTLDALHLAMAADLGGTLATFDRKLADAACDLGIDVVS